MQDVGLCVPRGGIDRHERTERLLAGFRQRIVVVEVVDELLDADGILRRHLSLVEETPNIGIGESIDIYRERRDGMFAHPSDGIWIDVLITLAVKPLADALRRHETGIVHLHCHTGGLRGGDYLGMHHRDVRRRYGHVPGNQRRRRRSSRASGGAAGLAGDGSSIDDLVLLLAAEQRRDRRDQKKRAQHRNNGARRRDIKLFHVYSPDLHNYGRI